MARCAYYDLDTPIGEDGVARGLADRGDLANEILAKRNIELAKAGERNPDLLCEGVLKEFRERRL
jgi:hypothetical protein